MPHCRHPQDWCALSMFIRRLISCNEATYDVALRQRAGSRPMTFKPFIKPRAKAHFRPNNRPHPDCAPPSTDLQPSHSTPTHRSILLVLLPLPPLPLHSSYNLIHCSIPFKVSFSFLLSRRGAADIFSLRCPAGFRSALPIPSHPIPSHF